jgi:hypothetical protein
MVHGTVSVIKVQWNRPRSEPDFFLFEITEPWWLEFPIARTHFDSPFEFEPAKFYCSSLQKTK